MNWLKILLGVAGLAALIAAPIGQGTYFTYVLCSWLIFSIAAMGLNLTLGYAGQVSLAQAAFMGIGAYITALMTMAGIPWIVAFAAAVGATFVIGLLLGYRGAPRHTPGRRPGGPSHKPFRVILGADWIEKGGLRCPPSLLIS
ncbi:MAG: ABC transporter permease subunit [Magnetospiraceae bacterium]